MLLGTMYPWTLLVVAAHAAPAALQPRDDWRTISCNDANITDASVESSLRWNAADTNTSWKAAVAAWQAYNPGPGQVPLKFGAFISNFFRGPEGWNCQDPTDVPCSTTVSCWSVNHPAGFLILNSFAKLHMIFLKFHEAIQDAEMTLNTIIGDMMNTFAPELKNHDPALLEKMIFDTLQIIMLWGTAYCWNVLIWGVSFFKHIGYKQQWKDSFNAVGTGMWSYSKDSRVFLQTPISRQNELASSMGYMFDVFRTTQTKFLTNLFSGADNGSLAELEGMIANGMMHSLPDDIDFTQATKYFETIVLGQLIPRAWQLNKRNYSPFILTTGDACSDTLPMTLNNFMSQNTHVSASVCWLNNMFWVLTISQYEPLKEQTELRSGPTHMQDREFLFNSMTGGRHSDLDGKSWGGITLEDIVVSSYYGYLNNGGRNGYNISLDDSHGRIDTLMFEGGVRAPGFFSLPVCTNLWTTMANLIENRENEPDFPCSVIAEKTIPDLSNRAKVFEGLK